MFYIFVTTWFAKPFRFSKHVIIVQEMNAPWRSLHFCATDKDADSAWPAPKGRRVHVNNIRCKSTLKSKHRRPRPQGSKLHTKIKRLTKVQAIEPEYFPRKFALNRWAKGILDHHDPWPMYGWGQNHRKQWGKFADDYWWELVEFAMVKNYIVPKIWKCLPVYFTTAGTLTLPRWCTLMDWPQSNGYPVSTDNIVLHQTGKPGNWENYPNENSLANSKEMGITDCLWT